MRPVSQGVRENYTDHFTLREMWCVKTWALKERSGVRKRYLQTNAQP